MSLLITLIVARGLGFAAASAPRRRADLDRTRYNNRYNDAPAARDDHVA